MFPINFLKAGDKYRQGVLLTIKVKTTSTRQEKKLKVHDDVLLLTVSKHGFPMSIIWYIYESNFDVGRSLISGKVL